MLILYTDEAVSTVLNMTLSSNQKISCFDDAKRGQLAQHTQHNYLAENNAAAASFSATNQCGFSRPRIHGGPLSLISFFFSFQANCLQSQEFAVLTLCTCKASG